MGVVNGIPWIWIFTAVFEGPIALEFCLDLFQVHISIDCLDYKSTSSYDWLLNFEVYQLATLLKLIWVSISKFSDKQSLVQSLLTIISSNICNVYRKLIAVKCARIYNYIVLVYNVCTPFFLFTFLSALFNVFLSYLFLLISLLRQKSVFEILIIFQPCFVIV